MGSAIQLELKIIVDKEKSRVLFAEADGYFVDCIFSFLTFPLGTIARLNGNRIGCFSNLYESVMNLINTKHSFFVACPDMLLKPKCLLEEEFRKLKLNIDDTEPPKYYTCSYCISDIDMSSNSIRLFKGIHVCPKCHVRIMDKETSLDASNRYLESKGEVFVIRDSTYIITDNLQVIALHHPRTVVELLNKLGIEDMSVVEERTVTLGLTQLQDLLKWTLVSTTPLSDLFLKKREIPASTATTKNLLLKKEQNYSSDQVEVAIRMDVKVMLKKSNKELLFVEGQQDFIDLLFSFLTIPLVEMMHMLDGASGLGSIDSLYKTVLDFQCFISENHKNIMLRPKSSPCLKRRKQLFPLKKVLGSCVMEGIMDAILNPKLPKVETKTATCDLAGFVGKETVLLVTDNLGVIPFSSGSVISILNRHKCSPGDLEEKILSIGIPEVLGILKACLDSESVLSNGLFHKLNLKEPKQEI